MNEYYIEKYMTNLLENTYSDDLERLKAVVYGLESISNSIERNIETPEERYNYNKIITCLITLKEIVEAENNKQILPF